MKALIFDCETNGKIKDKTITDMHQVDNFPRCIQIAWILADEKGNDISRHCSLICPEDWTIPEEPFWIEHGFSTAKNKADGIPMAVAIDRFLYDYNESDFLVAHHLNFDYLVLGSEMIRYGKRGKTNHDRVRICTMEASTNLCKIPFGKDHRPWKNNNWKFPRLSELYKFLFDKELTNNHDALNDVIATKECFFELVSRGIINISKPVIN